VYGASIDAQYGARLSVTPDGSTFVSYHVNNGDLLSDGDPRCFTPSVQTWSGTAYTHGYAVHSICSTAPVDTNDVGVSIDANADHWVVGGGENTSKAFIYSKDDATNHWTVTYTLAFSGAPEAGFGQAVAMPYVGNHSWTGSAAVMVSAPAEVLTGPGDGVVVPYTADGSAPAAVTSIDGNESGVAQDDFGDRVYYRMSNESEQMIFVVGFDTDSAYGQAYTSVDGSSWTKKGSLISLACTSATNGVSGAISPNGLVVAIGCPSEGVYGKVIAYEWDTDAWVPRGGGVLAGNDGSLDAKGLGTSISFNTDGTRMAVGSRATGTTYAVVYEYTGGAWVPTIDSVDSTVTGDALSNTYPDLNGIQVALSANGNVLTLGNPGYNIGVGDDTYGTGYVTSYVWSPSLPAPTHFFSAAPTQLPTVSPTRPPTPEPTTTSLPSSVAKHSDAVLGGSIGGVAGGLLLIAGGVYWYKFHGPGSRTLSVPFARDYHELVGAK